MKPFGSPSVYKKRRWPAATLLALAVLLTGPATLYARTTPASSTWMTVLLDGRKIGHARFTRTVAEDKITSVQYLQLELQRDGRPMVIETRETDVESPAGKPLAFQSMTRVSGAESSTQGQRRADGRFEVTSRVGGRESTTSMARPAGALLAEGQRLAAVRFGAEPGTDYAFLAWDVNSGKALPTKNRVIGTERTSLPGGERTLLRIEQTSTLPVGSVDTTLWLDGDFAARKIRTSMLGMKLELLACDRACAMAPNQGVDILEKSMTAMPRALTKAEVRGPITYTIAATGSKPLHFADTDEQLVTRDDQGNWQVQVRLTPKATQDKPVAADTAANGWLQSDNRRLRRLAQQESRGASTDAARMHKLETFVSRYINKKNLGVGYASALEVMRDREGDCTEHAVLLAALARSLDIPARVVTGLVYSDHYAGRDHVLVPHAWVQAWVGDHWRSFDAALGGFDTGHIALETGDGDPWHFFAVANTLGKLRVVDVSSRQHKE